MNIVGLNSAVPRPLFYSGGQISAEQLRLAKNLLEDFSSDGADSKYFNVVLVHHPMLRRHSEHHEKRSGLEARDNVAVELARSEAHLILHGHTHEPYVSDLFPVPGHGTDTSLVFELVPRVIEAGSGTYVGPKKSLWARYNIYNIREGGWLEAIAARRLTNDGSASIDAPAFEPSYPVFTSTSLYSTDSTTQRRQ